jgi:hypothetical protein
MANIINNVGSKCVIIAVACVWLNVRLTDGHPSKSLGRTRAGSVDEYSDRFIYELLDQHYKYCGLEGLCSGYRVNRQQSIGGSIDDNSTRCLLCSQCQCDDECFRFGDCCPDKLMTSQKKAQQFQYSSTSSCIHLRVNGDGSRNLEFPVERTESEYPKMIYVISSCPNNTADIVNQSTRAKCIGTDDIHPVTSTVTSLTYRNSFCAKCHDDNVELTMWPVQLACRVSHGFQHHSSPKDFISTVLTFPDCNAIFTPPCGVKVRQCDVTKYISACNVTGRWNNYNQFLQKACDSYKTAKFWQGSAYQNVFCYICNTDHPVLDEGTCYDPPPTQIEIFTAYVVFPDVGRPREHDDEDCNSGQNLDLEVCLRFNLLLCLFVWYTCQLRCSLHMETIGKGTLNIHARWINLRYPN